MIGPRTIAIDHADMANRVLRRLVTAQGAPADLLASLHRLRRRVEYWTDRLVGAIDCDHAPRWAAFDADRAKRFGETPWSEPASSGTDARLREIRDALRGAFASVLSEPTAHGPSNGRVAAAVVSAWGRGPGSGPPPQAVWIEHLFTQTADAAEWVHDALACGNGPALEGPVRCRFDGRARLRGRHVR